MMVRSSGNNLTTIWEILEKVWTSVSVQSSKTAVPSNKGTALYSAVITALSLSCATAVMRNVNYDDILATASKHVSPRKNSIPTLIKLNV